MKAVVIVQPGGRLELRDVAQPAPLPGQVLVRVHATAVNRADLLQAAGRYPVPAGAPQDIPGLEFAGEVAVVGSDDTGWDVGDRVLGIVGGGAYAEYVTVHCGSLVAIPGEMPWHEAAAVPEAFMTGHDALITQAGLQPGETVLIHAVGSGVGLAAVQIVRWRGGAAYGTTRTPEKLESARGNGLTDGIVVTADLSPIADAVAGWRGDAGMDVVLDLVGGPYVAADLDALGFQGRLILVGTIAGNRADVKLDRILRKRLTVRGTVLRSRSDAEKAQVTAAFARDLIPAFSRGQLRADVHGVLPLEKAAEAHRIVAEDRNTGKVVLSVW